MTGNEFTDKSVTFYHITVKLAFKPIAYKCDFSSRHNEAHKQLDSYHKITNYAFKM
jgi:hypothetical protein